MAVRIAPLVLMVLLRAATATTVGIQRALGTLFLSPSLFSALKIHRRKLHCLSSSVCYQG